MGGWGAWDEAPGPAGAVGGLGGGYVAVGASVGGYKGSEGSGTGTPLSASGLGFFRCRLWM